jgi:hypothetical protein
MGHVLCWKLNFEPRNMSIMTLFFFLFSDCVAFSSSPTKDFFFYEW